MLYNVENLRNTIAQNNSGVSNEAMVPNSVDILYQEVI